eukprot:scpid103251/ scgid9157/ 
MPWLARLLGGKENMFRASGVLVTVRFGRKQFSSLRKVHIAEVFLCPYSTQHPTGQSFLTQEKVELVFDTLLTNGCYGRASSLHVFSHCNVPFSPGRGVPASWQSQVKKTPQCHSQNRIMGMYRSMRYLLVWSPSPSV